MEKHHNWNSIIMSLRDTESGAELNFIHNPSNYICSRGLFQTKTISTYMKLAAIARPVTVAW